LKKEDSIKFTSKFLQTPGHQSGGALSQPVAEAQAGRAKQRHTGRLPQMDGKAGIGTDNR